MAAATARPKEETMKDARPPTPFERLTDFARRIVAVPKAEVDRRAAEYRKRRKRKAKK